ncbi:acyl-CoA dehydrogenase family protein [Actinomycetota bacterium]|nr:acyl-CoA dehydrogenase family protein [Actinomycetota bacterium]
MDLTYPQEAEDFRVEISGWLKDNLPEGWFEPGFSLNEEEKAVFNREWPKKLFEGGWICATWPTEYGGRGLTTMQGVVLAEEFARARAPMRGDFFGDTLVGPTLLQWGTEEQKQEFLPRILKGEIRWCQGFSEPNSGSDLASLKTTAVLDGNEWVINGQKVWTTQGHHADYCFLLTRTDAESPKHAGISYLLVPMRQPGIEVRGITQPDGTAEFCEVFFTDARCPADNVVGGINNGWKVANSTLAFERGQSATTGYRRFEEEYRILAKVATENGRINDPLIRQRLMEYYTKVQILRVNGLRNLTSTLNKTKDMGTIALGATNKMFWSEMHKAAMELALDIFGAESMMIDSGPASGSWPGALRDRRRDGYPVSAMMSSFFFSRSSEEVISPGTCNCSPPGPSTEREDVTTQAPLETAASVIILPRPPVPPNTNTAVLRISTPTVCDVKHS